MKQIANSELIVKPDGSIYHLHLLPEQIADDIILVGDQGRVDMISQHFSSIECKVQNREFVTHTGIYKGKRITVLSTGIGTDNIDIVVNELDALANIDLKQRTIKTEHKALNLVRIGTSGGLQEHIDVGSFLLTETSIGFDGLLNFYANGDSVCDTEMQKYLKKFLNWNERLTSPYVVNGSNSLLNRFGDDFIRGITISAPGFYGPQGRVLRLPVIDPDINDKITLYNYRGKKITNYEMESSAIYGLGAMLGHNAATVCVIIANRKAKTFLEDYKPRVAELVLKTLDLLAAE
jgi:uridine phosphorylase